jgi:putative ABC transport system ATP-binding protein
MPVLDVVDVWKSYGDGENLISAVRQANVVLDTGEFVALVGPSGCGKSTLLHLCGAMDRPTRGTINIDSESIGALDDDRLTRLRRERIGFVFQFFNLLPTLTVEQNIALPLLLAGRSEAAVFREVRVLADRVGLLARLGHFPQQLSGGEAQRAAIARAIIHQPALLIADEPTGNLDSENGAHVLKLLSELNDQVGTAVLMATHDERVAADADRVIQMRDGAVVSDGFMELGPRG